MIREGDDEGPTTITVSIEVVLAEAPIVIIAPEVTSDDEATEAPLDDTLPIKPKYILPLPFFRFRFIEGSCVETPTVLDADGATSESWEEIVQPDLSATSQVRDSDTMNESNGGNGSNGNSNKEVVFVPTEEQEGDAGSMTGEGAEIKETAPLPKRYKWTQEFQIEKVNDEFLIQLNERPHIVVTLGCKEDLASSTDSTLRIQPPINTGNLLGFLPMDISPLLDGDTSISKVCNENERNSGNIPAGLLEWKLNISIPEPLLNKNQRLRLNPLSIHFHRVVRLPGIDIEYTRNPRMLQSMLPTRFRLLKEHCYPIFSLFQFNIKRNEETIELMNEISQKKKTTTNEDGSDGSNESNGDGETSATGATASSASNNTMFQRVVSTISMPQEIESELQGPTEEELKAMEKAKKKRARQKGKGKKNQKGGTGANKKSIYFATAYGVPSEGADLPERDRRRRDVSFNHKTTILSGLLNKIDLLDYLKNNKLILELHDR